MSNCVISGVILNIDGTPAANSIVTFAPPNVQPITAQGNVFSGQPVSTMTDINGNLTPITLQQGLLVTVTISENGASFGNFVAIVPFASAATFAQMALGIQPPTGNMTVNGQQLISSNGTFTAPAGVTSFMVECWGGGGGGGGYGGGHTDGGNGGTTTVKNFTNTVTLVSATGGFGGISAATNAIGAGGGGGSGTIGTVLLIGGTGFQGNVNQYVTVLTVANGGVGGTAPRGNVSAAQNNAFATPFGGGGWGGGAGANGGSPAGGGGGGAGGYAQAIVQVGSPTIYNVVVGTAGAAGTGGSQNGVLGDIGGALFTW